MERILTVENAQISTVSVQLKSLTVGHKQVTQAVFRQLLEESIIDFETGKLLGTPWGHINYFWGAQAEKEYTHENLNIVWQKGNELRRYFLSESLDSHSSWKHRYLLEEQRKSYEAAADKLLRMGYPGFTQETEHAYDGFLSAYVARFSFEKDDFIFAFKSDAFYSHPSYDGNGKRRVPPSKMNTGNAEQMDQLAEVKTLDAVLLQWRQLLSAQAVYSKELAISAAALRSVPQLFIAV